MSDEGRSRSSCGRRRFLYAVGASALTTGLAGCAVRTTESGVEVEFGDGPEPTATTGVPMQTTTPTDAPESTTAETTASRPSTATTSTATRTTATTTATTAKPPRSGGTLQLTSGTLTTLDPIRATDSASAAVVENLFDGLTTFPDGATTAELQLATDVTVSSDGRTYTASLRDDATFHDGSPVTASDVVYSWERLAASDHSITAYYLLDYLGVDHNTVNGEYDPNSMAVRAVDDHTLEFSLAEPFHAALELLALPAFAVVPEGIVGDVRGYSGRVSYQSFAKGPIGSGPFTLDRWTQRDEVVLSRFSDYHGQAPDLDGVRWKIVTDPTAEYTYGQNGSADFVTVPDDRHDPGKLQISKTDAKLRRFGTYGPMQNGETVSYLGTPLTRTYYLAFNADRVVKPVRQATAYAMNQREVVDQLLEGRAEPAAHLTPPAIYPNDEYTAHADDHYPYGYESTELHAATQVMEDAGYGASNKYEFTLTTYQSPILKELGQLLQDKLGVAHIDMKDEQEAFSTFFNRLQKGDVDAYVFGWFANWPRPDDFLKNLNPPATQTDGSADGFYVNWSGTDASDQAERAWQRVAANADPTERARQIRERAYVSMERANWEDVLVIPLYHPIDERFASDGVDAAPFGGLGSTYQEYNRVVKRT
jgi:peptide/nickel transport system substrate-binding protein